MGLEKAQTKDGLCEARLACLQGSNDGGIQVKYCSNSCNEVLLHLLIHHSAHVHFKLPLIPLIFLEMNAIMNIFLVHP